MRAVEQRRGDRLLCAGLVEVRWVESSTGVCKAFANLDDLSSNGVSLVLDRPVTQGTRVEFLHSGKLVCGDVRHCTQNDIGWIVGVHFGPDSRWDPSTCPPEHLLDPNCVPEGLHSRAEPPLAPEIKNTIACLVLSQAVRLEEE